MAVGFENLKNAIGQGADVVITQMQERATKLYKEFGGDKATVVFDKMKAEYIDAKNWLDGKAGETANKITNELNQLVQEAKIKADAPTSKTTESTNTDAGINGSKSIDYPELASKKLMEFDAGLNAVQATGFSEFRIKDKLDQSKLSAEQIKNLEAFDKVQASLYIMLRNASKRDLPAGFLMRASVVMTKDLFDHMGDGKSSGGFDLSKMTEGAKDLAYNKTIGAGVGELKKSADGFVKSFKESGAADMISSVQTWLGMFNNLSDITSKWNNFLGWIADGDLTGIDLTKSTLPAIYTVYQGCKSGYPSAEQTQGLSVAGNDADWIGKNSGKMLSTSHIVLGHLKDNTERLIESIVNTKNQDGLNKFVNQSEGIIDTMIETASSMGLSSDMLESMMSSWGKRFEKFAFIGRMLGVDMTPLISTLNAKLSPKQEQQLTAFLKSYQPFTAMGPHEWEQYISDDPESKKQGIVQLINVGDIKKGLVVMTPAASVVRQFVGDDETKKMAYFDKDETGHLTILKDWSKVSDADKTALADGYMTNENVIKNLLKDVTGADGDDMKVVGRAATGYMKGARGDKFYDTYVSKHANDRNEKNHSHEAVDDSETSFSLNQKIPLNESWKTNLNTKLYALDNKTKLDFALARIGVGTNSLFTKAATNILKAREVGEDRLANFVLGMGAVAYGESKFNTNLVNNIRPDKHQKSYGIRQRSLDGNPAQAIKEDVIRLSKSTYVQGLSIPTADIDVNDPQIQALSYLGYLLDKDGIKKDSYNIFERVTNLPTMNPSEVDVAVRDQIQFSAKEAKNGRDAYNFLRNSTIADHIETPKSEVVVS